MPGIIKLEADGEVITQQKFNCNGDIKRIVAIWEKRYPKGFHKCRIVIEKEPGILKTKSRFKKGDLPKVTKGGRANRGIHLRYLDRVDK